MHANITLNEDQKLYVIPCGEGYTCYGFENCYQDSIQLAAKLKRPDLLPDVALVGSLEMYQRYQSLLDIAKDRNLGTWFSPGTPEIVCQLLENARISRKKIRIFYGDPQTGRDWLEEFDTIGRVGCSTGTLKEPLLITEQETYGGGAILTNRIVKIMALDDDLGWGVYYQHPLYHQPDFTVESEGSTFNVLANGILHATLYTRKSANSYIEFMTGKTLI